MQTFYGFCWYALSAPNSSVELGALLLGEGLTGLTVNLAAHLNHLLIQGIDAARHALN